MKSTRTILIALTLCFASGAMAQNLIVRANRLKVNCNPNNEDAPMTITLDDEIILNTYLRNYNWYGPRLQAQLEICYGQRRELLKGGYMSVLRDGSFVGVSVNDETQWAVLTSEIELEATNARASVVEAERKATEYKTKLDGLCRERISSRARRFYCE